MTKSQFRILQGATKILSQLEESDKQNPRLNPIYRNSISTVSDELDMLIHCVNEHPEVFTHQFWNDELADHVAKTVLAKDRKLTATVEREWHGEFTLKLDGDNIVDEWEYEHYLDEDEAWEDAKELVRLGFQIDIP